MADNKILIEVSVAGNAEVQFKKLSDSVANFGVEAKKTFADSGRIFDNFVANIASSAVQGAFELFKKGFSEITEFVSESVKAATEQENAINALNAALRQSGQFSSEASKGLQEFAESLQATTGVADDAIIGATALISTLGQLDEKGLKGATKAALDLSAALQIDLQSAANLVGKAAEGNVGVLKRYGIEVKDTGDKARDFATALDLINERFGGRAEAQLKTFSGALGLLGNQFNDVQESIGDAIIKSPVVIEAFKIIGEQIGVLSKFLADNKVQVNAFVNESLIKLVEYLVITAEATNFLARAFKVFYADVQILISTMSKLNVPLALLALFNDTAKELKNSLIELGDQGFKNLEAAAGETFLDSAAAGLERIRDRLKEVSEETANSSIAIQEDFAVRKALVEEDDITQEARRQNAILSQTTEQSTALASYANFLLQRNETLKKFNNEQSRLEITSNTAKLQEIKNSTFLVGKERIEIVAKLNEEERQRSELLFQQKRDILTNLSTLSNAKTKELAIVGKAAAIAQATISTFLGAANALSSVPYPLNFVAAASVVAAGLVQVSNIAGVGLATGISEVPPGFQNDTFPARLSSGERVVSAPQNRDLTEFLAGSTGLTAKLDQLIAVLSINGGRTTVNIGGREIIGAIQGELDSGRSLVV